MDDEESTNSDVAVSCLFQSTLDRIDFEADVDLSNMLRNEEAVRKNSEERRRRYRAGVIWKQRQSKSGMFD